MAICFGSHRVRYELWFINEYEKVQQNSINNELVRTDTNSCSRSSYEFVSVRCLNCVCFSYQAQSYEEIGKYWDTHDLAENWEETKPVKFEVDIQSEWFQITKGKPDKGLVVIIATTDKFKQNSGRHGSIRTYPLLPQSFYPKNVETFKYQQ